MEEKLQKLHSEIKFALKVDNPVRYLLRPRPLGGLSLAPTPAWLRLLLPCWLAGGDAATPGAHGETSRHLLILVSPSQDIKRCLNALEELGTLQVTSHILQKHTDVVATLKKVGQGVPPLCREPGACLGHPSPEAIPSPSWCRSVAIKQTRT